MPFHVCLINFEAMKTIKAFILLLAIAVLPACEFVTYEDDDCDNLIGTAFEVEGDFTSANDFRLVYDFPNNFEVFESDVVLVYILWEQVTGSTGKTMDVWRLLPQTVVLNEGVLQYNYDYSRKDVQIFLGGTIDLYTLLPAESQDQVFRIVVLPADFAVKKSLDLTDFGGVMKSLGLEAK